jgi:hypothetical protein
MLSQRTAFKPALARNPAGSRRVSTIVRADAGPSPDMQVKAAHDCATSFLHSRLYELDLKSIAC